MTSDTTYCFDRACVLFAIHPRRQDAPRIVCEISEDALRDVFGSRGDGDDLVQTCRRHLDLIEAAAFHRYHQDPTKPVKLETADFIPASITDPIPRTTVTRHVEAVQR